MNKIEITKETFEALRAWRQERSNPDAYDWDLLRQIDADPAFRPKTRAEQVNELLPEGWPEVNTNPEGAFGHPEFYVSNMGWSILSVSKKSTLTPQEIVDMALKLAGVEG